MTYSYFPGCTLKNKAQDLDKYGRMSAEALGFTLEEIPEWQCCGAVYPLVDDVVAERLPSVRALMAARDKGQALVTMCSACHHVIKRVNIDMKSNFYIRTHANSYMKNVIPYVGETEVLHYLEVLRDKVGFDVIKSKVVKPLTGRKIGAYYGCLLLRPSAEMAMDDPENPSIIEDFIRAIGAEPVVYAMRNECCGGYVTLKDNDAAKKQVNRILTNAKSAGVDELVTACPLCMYNLTKNSTDENRVPVTYFTELLAEALGLK